MGTPLRLLLDTHTLLWCLSDDPQLSPTVRAAVDDPLNSIFVSSISIVEIALKVQIGKLSVPIPIDQLTSAIRGRVNVRQLPLSFTHAVRLASLPLLHRDIFDRMLIVQALAEKLTLATADAAIAAYNIPILW